MDDLEWENDEVKAFFVEAGGESLTHAVRRKYAGTNW